MEQRPPQNNIFLSQEELERMKGYDLAGVRKHFSGVLDQMKNTKVTVAVTGETGAGKSLFINTIRGLRSRAQAPDIWADTGVKEQTMERKDYPHPANRNIVFVDLPGCGGMKFTRENYLQLFDFSKFDFVIVVSKDRFLQDDAWLLRHLHNLRVPSFLVRTHIDVNIETNEESEGKDAETTLEEVRTDIRRNLDLLKIGGCKFYLISARFPHIERWDFPELNKDILHSLPGWKKDNFLNALPVYALEWVKAKKAALETRMFVYTAASGVVALVPLPGVSITCDVGILMGFASDCYQSYGLSGDALNNLVAAIRADRSRIGNARSLCQRFFHRNVQRKSQR
jgi:interferon gamma inducible protein 47